ncbi:hypothetical protein FF2_044576 [Malus domestica]
MARRVFEVMEERSVVSWTAILDGVVKLDGVGNGRVVFDQMNERNEVAWTIMIVGYPSIGLICEIFSFLGEKVFGSCAQSGDRVTGSWVQAYALKTMENEIDIMVGTALVDMYAKFGTVDTALKVFEQMHRRNEATWNALHGGLAMHGRGKLVLNMFPQMLEEAKPDELTFIALLTACSHSGLFDQGRHYFYNLQALHGATPQIEHCACMVDLLGRAGNWKRLKY